MVVREVLLVGDLAQTADATVLTRSFREIARSLVVEHGFRRSTFDVRPSERDSAPKVEGRTSNVGSLD